MSQQTPAASAPADSAAPRYWIRNEAGRIWGPFGLDAISRVDVGGSVDAAERVLVSIDGQSFVAAREYPEVVAQLERQSRPPPSRASPRMATMPGTPQRGTASMPASRSGAQPRIDVPPPPPPPKQRQVTSVPVENPGPPADGEIEATSAAELYSRIASIQLTGKLSIHAKDGAFGMFFKKGTPERIEIPKAGATLAELLEKRRLVPAPALRQALEQAGGADGDLVPALVAGGLIAPHDLFPILGEHGIELLLQVLSLDNGHFVWSPGIAAPAGSFALGQRWELFCRWARQVPRVTVRRRLGDRMYRAAYRSSGARVTLEELHLTAQEARVATAFDGTRSPEQISIEVAQDADVVYRTALLLAEVGFLSFGPALRRATEVTAAMPKAAPAPPPVGAAEDDLPPPSVPSAPAKAAPPPSKPPPTSKPPSRPSTSPISRPRTTLAELSELLEKWKRANHFQVLHVPEVASQADIKSAYLALARQYHPDTVTDPAQQELRAVKADLTARLNDAYQILGETKSRVKYITEIQEGGQVDIRPILQAEEDFLRATILVKARKLTEAIALLDRAIQLNPAEAELHAWRAWARFGLAPSKRDAYEAALAECTRVVKEAPRCAAAHLFIGQMAKIMGDQPRAERAFRAVLDIEPENIDARRELRSGKV